MRKLFKKLLCSVLCLAMLISCFSVGSLSALAVTMTDYGKNPTPDIDIAVSVPADYPGTFDDFKAELTAALIAQGMDASTFRITDTAVKIDTTNLDGWYVYDHYYNQAAYNALGLSAAQQTRQPFRQADNTCMTSHGKSGVSTPCLIQDVFVEKRWGTPGNKLYPFNQHTYSWETNGRANMCFAGYGTNALTDYMFYPATSDSRRTIEFDLDCAVIDLHTLLGAGFLLNTAISGGKLAGYAFYYEWTSATAATAQIRKLQNVDVNFTGSPGTVLAGKSVSLPSGTKLRIRVVLERNRVTVTQRTYSGSSMGDEVVLFDNYEIPILPAAGNGFGPIVAYKSHGCASMTYFQYGDLNMTYDATAFDALKSVQYVQSSKQKYFVNLVNPENEDTGIPDPSKDSEGYIDGITRMDQNEIFYISNKDDGRVGTDDDGIGATNTIYTSTDTDFIQELASKIITNYTEDKTFAHINTPDREDPLSDFYVINSTEDENGKINGSQLMTVHQRHLINTNTSLQVSLRDKSQLGNMPTSGTKLTKYEVKLLDPDGNEIELVKGQKTVTITPNADGSVTFPEYTVDGSTKPGRYTFSMLVTDDKGNESGWVSTYFTVFDDSEEPIASGENTSRNRARIHLTDTGQGIDEDGITFIEDNRGSGVYAYYITDSLADSEDPRNNPDLWIYLDEPVHEYTIDVDLMDYVGQGKQIVVYYMDECRNVGQEAIFKPVHVIVKDGDDDDKDPIDDYYVIGKEPIVSLPDVEVTSPDPDNPDLEFSGWKVDGGDDDDDDLTENKKVPVKDDDDEPTIVIRPNFTDHKVNLTYVANATGAYIPKAENNAATYTIQIAENSDLAAKIKAQNVVPVRTGYNFVGWYMDAACTQPVVDQVAATNTTVYAGWEIATYTINFDHNGGGTSGKTKIENVPYGTKLALIATAGSQYEVKANEAPTKPGYIFQYWTLTKNDPNTRITSSISNTMPANDVTVYAYYLEDTSKYVVKFDTKGGNNIANKAYVKSATGYGTLQKPVKSGYDFEGWYIQNADGTMSDQKVELSGTTIPANLRGVEHTLVANWTPSERTPYTVAYYYNSGNKDAQGNYRYVKANNMTKTYYAPTESEVTIPQEAILDELEGSEFQFSRSYWLNDKHPDTRLKGTVVGGTPLELRLYYDRYFTITTQVVSGDHTGTIWADDINYDWETSTLRVKEGEIPTVKWKPAEGYHTANVALDNRIRDGLRGNGGEGSYTFEEEIHKDYYFRVRFEEGEPTSTPTAKDYYTIDTRIEGCYDGSCTITPTGRYIAGRDSVEITWDINEDVYRIQSIQIDQTIFFRSQAALDNYVKTHPDYKDEHLNLSVDDTFAKDDFTRFRRIAQDHKVIVTVDKIPTVGGNATSGFYTVTVNTYGGDAEVASQVVSSQVLNPGANYSAGPANSTTPSNKVTSDKLDIVAIFIDGARIMVPAGQNPNTYYNTFAFSSYRVGGTSTGKQIFRNIDGNHVIDIFFAPKGTDPEEWHEKADEDEIDFNKLNTKIVGGPGTITSGGYIDKDNADRTITWNIQDGKTNGQTPDTTDKDGNIIPNTNYSEYEVDTVTVTKTVYDDEGKPKTETTTYTKEQVEKNEVPVKVDKETEVVVNLKPAYRTVTVLKYGHGTTSETKTLFKNQSYTDIIGTPGPTSKLVKLVVDGEVKYDYYNTASTEKTSLLSDFISLFAAEDATGDVTEVNSVDTTGTKLGISNLQEDHIVEVYFAEMDPDDGTPKTLPEKTHKVAAYANINGVEFEGQGIVEDGDNAFVSWKTPAGYEVESVTLNGVTTTDITSISIPEVTEDQKIFVTFVLTNDPTTKVSLKGDPSPNNLFKVETSIVGGKGTITETKSYAGGENAYVEWKAEPEQVVNNSIFYDRAEKSESATVRNQYKNYIELIGDHYTSEGRIPGELNYPVDTDGDGVIDLILNWDYEGDGVPEYNIVLNGIEFNSPKDRTLKDYHIDINYAPIIRETDDEGNEVIKPDTSNLGTAVGLDGSTYTAEVLDINSTVERKERKFVVKYVIIDGKVSFYSEQDENPDSITNLPILGDDGLAHFSGNNYTFTNLDRNHTIVVVVGTDPSTNLPPDVDIDGDGEPDINVDIDGDGIPDVDIDKDGDGVPDLNIDKDNDGEPDEKIDTDKPTMPDPTDPTKEIPNPGYLREDTRIRVNYLLPGHQELFPLDDLGKSDMGDEYDTLPSLLKHLGLTEKDVTITQDTENIKDENGNVIENDFVVYTRVKINADKLNNKVEALDADGNKTTICLGDYDIYSDDPISGVTRAADELITYRFQPKETKVNVEFIQVDGEKKTTKVEVPGHVFDDYTFAVNNEYVTYINSIDAFGYKLLNTKEYPEPANASGTMTLDPITVKYYFALMDTQIIVRLEDEEVNLVADGGLAQIDGGKKYNEDYRVTPPSQVYGYVLDRTQLPDNATGTVHEDLITVTFKYVPKDASVKVKYIDADTGKELAKTDTITGKFNSEYTAEAENIPGYVLVSKSATVKGIFAETQNNTDIVFEYKRAAKVIVKHIDRNGKEIVEPQEFDYKYGDTYEVSPIKDGKHTAYGVIGSATGVISQDTIVVVYLYNTDGDTTPTNPVTPVNPTTPSKPTKPTVNIDIDGDGEQDLNIDKDGDGEPDLNIDIDGDGEPDLNIDKDGDGEPDLNIDIDGDGKPDLNIDTDGDGEPDVNIDLDGDGIADANIDTDGDGIADKNIIGAPVDTGSTDMLAMYGYAAAAVAAVLLAVLLMKKNRKEDEAEAEA